MRLPGARPFWPGPWDRARVIRGNRWMEPGPWWPGATRASGVPEPGRGVPGPSRAQDPRGRVPWEAGPRSPGWPLRGSRGTRGPSGHPAPRPRVSSGRWEPELARMVSSGGTARTGPFSRFQVSPRRGQTGLDGKQLFSAVFSCFPLFSGFLRIQASLAYPSDRSGPLGRNTLSRLTFRFSGL